MTQSIPQSTAVREDLAMMFLELFVPRGAFTAEWLSQLAARLTMRQLLTHADAIGDVVDASEVSSVNLGVMDFIDSVNHVVVHEIGTWIVGGRPLDHAGPPCTRVVLAQLTVPRRSYLLPVCA